MSQMSRIIALAAAGALAVTMSACSAGGTGGGAAACNVGITMPTRSLERWINDGEQLQKKLKDAGCTVDLQYADNKVDQQISQCRTRSPAAPRSW